MDPKNQNGDQKPGNVIKPDNNNDNSNTEATNTDNQAAPQEANQTSPNVVKPTNEAAGSSNNDVSESTQQSEPAPQQPSPQQNEEAGMQSPQQSAAPAPKPSGQGGGDASVASFAVPKKKSGSKKLLIFGSLAAVVIAVLIGLGAYAYMEYTKPENRIKRAMGNLMEMDQGGKVGLEAGFIESSSSTDVQIVGEFTADEEKFHGSLGLEKIESGAIAFSSSFKPSVEVLYEHPEEEGQVPDDLYVKVSGIDESVLKQMVGSSRSFATMEQEIQEFYDTYHDAWIVVEDLQQYIDEQGDEETPNFKLTDEDREKLRDILTDAKLFTIEEELGSRDIDGVSAEGFEVVPDEEGMVETLKAIRDADLDIVEEINKQSETEVDFDEAIEGIEESSEEFESEDVEGTLELWLDGSELRQVVVKAQNEGDEGVDVNLAITLYGPQPVEVEIPSDAHTAEQLTQDFQQLYPQLLFGGYEPQTQPNQFNSSEFNSTFEGQQATPSSVLGAFDTR